MKTFTFLLALAVAAVAQNGRSGGVLPCSWGSDHTRARAENGPPLMVEQAGTATVGMRCQPENGVWPVRGEDGKIKSILFCENFQVRRAITQ